LKNYRKEGIYENSLEANSVQNWKKYNSKFSALTSTRASFLIIKGKQL